MTDYQISDLPILEKCKQMVIRNTTITIFFEGAYKEIIIKSSPKHTVEYIRDQISNRLGIPISKLYLENDTQMIDGRLICFYGEIIRCK